MGAPSNHLKSRRLLGGPTSRHTMSSSACAKDPTMFRGVKGTYLRDEMNGGNGGVSANPKPTNTTTTSTQHGRFTLRDLMHAPNAPLANLRSPLRRANSMANPGEKEKKRTPKKSPKKTKTKATLKTLMAENLENRDPVTGKQSPGPLRTTSLPNTQGSLHTQGNLHTQSTPNSPTCISGKKTGKRKVSPGCETELRNDGGTFSFFESKDDGVSNDNSRKNAISNREQELVDAISAEKAAAAAARASMSLGRWRLALAIQKANQAASEKHKTLTEMLRDQADDFDKEKSTRKAELRDALRANDVLRTQLVESDENVELLTEALGAATREKTEMMWRLSVKAVRAKAEAAACRRKLRRVVFADFEQSQSKSSKSVKSVVQHVTQHTVKTKTKLRRMSAENRDVICDEFRGLIRDEIEGDVREGLLNSLREELTLGLEKEMRKELRKNLRPIVEAEVRAEARADLEANGDAFAKFARMAKIGLTKDNAKTVVVENSVTDVPKDDSDNAHVPSTLHAMRASHFAYAMREVCKHGSDLRKEEGGNLGVAAAATRRLSNPIKRNKSNASNDILSQLAIQTVEAAAHARSRLNPLKGANVAELVALHEHAAAKLAKQAEDLVHEAEHMFFEPHRLEKNRAAPPHLATTALTPLSQGAVVVVPSGEGGGGDIVPGTVRKQETAKEPSMWDMWYR